MYVCVYRELAGPAVLMDEADQQEKIDIYGLELIWEFFFLMIFTALQGETQHAGHFGDEPVAGRQVARHRRLGRGGTSRGQLAALRGTRRRHHDIGPRPFQVRHAGPFGRRGRIRLGLLRVARSHSRFRQIR